MSDLSGKRILVTGAARGLGRAFAEAIADAGGQVILADILAEQGEQTTAELQKNGHAAQFVALDLADPDSISHCAGQAAAAFSGLDGLVNNGAIATGIGGKLLDEIDLETWDKVMTVNVRGTWLMTKAVAPYLRQNSGDRHSGGQHSGGQHSGGRHSGGRHSGGSIVNIASDTALWGAPRLLHYVASKGAVIAMTRSMARELGSDNIAVNSIAPGLTLVEATEYVPAERHRLYIDGRAIQREQQPEDITSVVVYLLSDTARFITGQLLPVNGGFVLN